MPHILAVFPLFHISTPTTAITKEAFIKPNWSALLKKAVAGHTVYPDLQPQNQRWPCVSRFMLFDGYAAVIAHIKLQERSLGALSLNPGLLADKRALERGADNRDIGF